MVVENRAQEGGPLWARPLCSAWASRCSGSWPSEGADARTLAQTGRGD